MRKRSTFQRWAWIELIGFDNTKPDFGVRGFLAKAGFVPDAVSLLLFNADFVHTHEGLEHDRNFPSDICSYGAHPYSDERQRQDWTRQQLRALIRELRSHGAEVYVAVFDLFVSQEWIGKHQELFWVRRNGIMRGSLCPFKRLADGRLYEDFFLAQLLAVMRDYEFDGYHCADGFAHPRLPISEGDFSDDMVDQFVQATGGGLPEGTPAQCGDCGELISARADWIWREKRAEWVRFRAERSAAFVRKITRALHAEGKKVAFNSAWTKDPFEALYRYGIDYRLTAAAGVDTFIVETSAGACELDGYQRISGRRPLYAFQAALLLMKGYAPNTPLILLNGIKDTLEQFSLVRHAPAALEGEIYAFGHLFRRDSGGRLERCAAGILACLADCIRREEWQRLRDWWKLALTGVPRDVIGVTLVWSDSAFERQLDDYMHTRKWHQHRIVEALLMRNAPVGAIVRIEDLNQARGAILVVQPHLLPVAELEQVLAYRGGPLLTIGAQDPRMPEAEWSLQDVFAPDPLCCSVYRAGRAWDIRIEDAETETVPADLFNVPEPSGGHAMFYHNLFFRKVSNSFLAACARVLADCAGVPRLCGDAEFVKVLALQLGQGRLRLLLSSESYAYVAPEVDVGSPIRHIDIRTQFPGIPVTPHGSRFRVRIPPRGAVVLDVAVGLEKRPESHDSHL